MRMIGGIWQKFTQGLPRIGLMASNSFPHFLMHLCSKYSGTVGGREAGKQESMKGGYAGEFKGAVTMRITEEGGQSNAKRREWRKRELM